LKLLSSDEAASYLGISPVTLAVWRSKKRGPKYIKVGGCVKYSTADLENFIKKNTIKPKHQ